MVDHSKPTTDIREAVGFFDNEKTMVAAIDDLLSHGFDRAEISVMTTVETVEGKLGQFFSKVSGLEDNPKVPHIAYIAKDDVGDAEGAVIGGLMYAGAMIGIVPVLISGGALVALITSAAIGGGVGTAIGSVLSGVIGHHHSEYISEQLEHGGLLLWVRTFTIADEKKAMMVLAKHTGHDVHVHGLPDVQSQLEDTYLGTLVNAQESFYKKAHIVRADTGAYYTSGKIFSSEGEAKAYIDRVEAVNAIYEKRRRSGIDMTAAMIDPADVFETPADLVKSSLNNRDKIELLHRWAYNETELEVASDDGMIDKKNRGDHLQEIEMAIAALEEG